MPPALRIEELLAPSVEALGYAIVRVQFSGGQRRPTLQIMAERLDGQPMSVDDCADISRAASAILDVEDPIPGEYLLEVSSPGIDRPLTRPEHFTRFAGFEARVDTDRPIDGRKRFKGLLLGIDEAGQVSLKEGEAVHLVPFASIQKAKLVLTDDLLRQSPDRPRT